MISHMTGTPEAASPNIIYPKSVGLLVTDEGGLLLAVTQDDGSADLFRIGDIEASNLGAMLNAVLD